MEDRPCAVDHIRASQNGTGEPTTGGRIGRVRRRTVAALRRIAFLLERSRAETYKVKAFRAAADTVLPLGDEVGRAGASGDPARAARHRRLHRRGDRGGGRRDGCPRGSPSSSGTMGGPLVHGGAEVRARLRGDLHSHSDWSDGGSPIEEMAFTAIELGHDYLVLTDHSPRLTVANGLSVARLTRQLEVVEAVNEHLADGEGTGGFRLLKGIEVDILDDGSLDQTDEMLGRLDVRVASVHSKLAMDKGPMTKRMVGGGPQPVHQRARALHRTAGHRQPRHPGAVGVRRRGGVRRLRGDRHGGRDQLAARASGPADRPARSGRSTWAACSRSTATPTRRGSSTSRSTAAPAPRSSASTPTGSSTPGRSSGCWSGRGRPGHALEV